VASSGTVNRALEGVAPARGQGQGRVHELGELVVVKTDWRHRRLRQLSSTTISATAAMNDSRTT
jgi:hypothetical protein